MDKSIAFWGNVQDTSGMIPATKLKILLDKPSWASEIAQKVWAKMSQDELDNVKKVETILMMNGEIRTDQLLDAFQNITEGLGMSFEDIFPEANESQVVTDAIEIMNELLHIYNQNEPPEILDDDDEFYDSPPASANTNTSLWDDNKLKIIQSSDENITNKIKKLIVKAKKHGLDDLQLPTSPSMSDRSKLQIIENQVKAKIRLKKLTDVINDRKEKQSSCLIERNNRVEKFSVHERRREINMKNIESLKHKPTFKTAVKSQTLEFKPTVRNVPDLKKRLKHAREKLYQKVLNDPDSSDSSNAMMVLTNDMCMNDEFNAFINKNKGKGRHGDDNNEKEYGPDTQQSKSGYAKDHFSKSQNYKKSIPINRKSDLNELLTIRNEISHELGCTLRSNNQRKDNYNMETEFRRAKNSFKIKENTKQVERPVQLSPNIRYKENYDRGTFFEKRLSRPSTSSAENRSVKEALKNDSRPSSRGEVLSEMKQMLREAIQEVSLNCHVQHRVQQTDSMNSGSQGQTYNQVSMSAFENDFDDTKVDEIMKVDIQRVLNENEDFIDIKVTEETPSQLLGSLNKEKTIATEICVSKLVPGPAVKLSLIKKSKSHENLNKLVKQENEIAPEAITQLDEQLHSSYSGEDTSKDEDSEVSAISSRPDTIGIENVNEPSDTANAALARRAVSEDLGALDLKPNVPSYSVNVAMMMEDSQLPAPREDYKHSGPFQLGGIRLNNDLPNIEAEVGDIGDVR